MRLHSFVTALGIALGIGLVSAPLVGLVDAAPNAGLKIGVIDLEQTLYETPVGKRASEAFDKTRKAKQSELDVLDAANDALGVDIGHLQTPEGAKEAARDELGVVGPGEERVSMLPTAGPLPLPTGWPYDTITKIVTVRQTVAP